MGNVFSFYQYEGTGLNGEILPISNPHYTDFTGFYVPASVIAGHTVGFLWRLFDDYEQFSPKVRIRMSGEAGNRFNENYYLSLVMSGNLSTVVTDSGVCVINVTGQVNSGTYEYATFSTLYTGKIISGKDDQPDFSTLISGEHPITHKDISSFALVCSGKIPSIYTDISSYGLTLSGGFTRKDKDVFAFMYELSGVAYRIGGRKNLATGNDFATINFNMTQVIYEWR